MQSHSIALNSIIFSYITLKYTQLHLITFNFIQLYYTQLHSITFNNILLRSITLHSITLNSIQFFWSRSSQYIQLYLLLLIFLLTPLFMSNKIAHSSTFTCILHTSAVPSCSVLCFYFNISAPLFFSLPDWLLLWRSLTHPFPTHSLYTPSLKLNVLEQQNFISSSSSTSSTPSSYPNSSSWNSHVMGFYPSPLL